ncbi:MAG: stage II sporulation protein M, partial [Lachnospiraceae bacterium]|nr:stage II sporulation protein M [Lachnospiraceae bacterium]
MYLTDIKTKFPTMSLFFTGFIAGILVMYFGKSILLENTGLLDENTFVDMKYMTVDSTALFYYVLKKRAGTALIIMILSTTYLGLIVCAAFSIWYGAAAGMFMSALLIRYGIKGLLLFVVSIFPQYILYLPAFAALIAICAELNRKIYFQKYGYTN